MADLFSAGATLITAVAAFLIYNKQKEDSKSNAARIILQEIRRAEDIISDYKEHREYKFTKKIIATNSWAKNIHYFVGELNSDELDKISTLYSTGEYLDLIVGKISDLNFMWSIKDFEDKVAVIKSSINKNDPNLVPPSQTVSPTSVPIMSQVPIQLPSPWKPLLDEITNKYEPIYNSTIAAKLKIIARIK